jgi:hypothetical protein
MCVHLVYIRKVWRYQRGDKTRTSKEDRQHNGQQKKYKGTNNDLQNTAQKTNDQATRTPLKPEGELRCSGRVGSSDPCVVPVVLSKLRLDIYDYRFCSPMFDGYIWYYERLGQRFIDNEWRIYTKLT